MKGDSMGYNAHSNKNIGRSDGTYINGELFDTDPAKEISTHFHL